MSYKMNTESGRTPSDRPNVAAAPRDSDKRPPLVLNPSLLRKALDCAYAAHAHGVLKVRPRLRRSSSAMDRGTVMHALLEYAITTYALTGEVFAFEGGAGVAAMGRILEGLYDKRDLAVSEELGHELLEAARFHVPRLGLEQWEVLSLDGEPLVEVDLRAPSGVDGVELQAIVDVVFRHKTTGEIWLIDWKTTQKSIDTAALRPFVEDDYQLELQRRILAHHGIKVDVSALVHLRSFAPQPPPLTSKKKQVSRNVQDLACDWPTYVAVLQDHHEDPDDPKYDNVRQALKTAAFDRFRVDASSSVVSENLWQQIAQACRDLLAWQAGERRPIRKLSGVHSGGRYGCGTCDYYRWCVAGMRHPTGADLSLLKTEYKTKPGSPLAGASASSSAVFDPDQAYLDFAADRGLNLTVDEECRP